MRASPWVLSAVPLILACARHGPAADPVPTQGYDCTALYPDRSQQPGDETYVYREYRHRMVARSAEDARSDLERWARQSWTRNHRPSVGGASPPPFPGLWSVHCVADPEPTPDAADTTPSPR